MKLFPFKNLLRFMGRFGKGLYLKRSDFNSNSITTNFIWLYVCLDIVQALVDEDNYNIKVCK